MLEGGRGVAFEEFHLASGSLRRSSTSLYYDGGRGCYSLFAGRSTSYPHEPDQGPPPFIKRLSTSWIVGRGSLLYQNLLICWTKLSIKIITCKLSLYFLSSLLDQECRVSLVLKDLPEWWISFNLEARFPQLYDMRSEKSFEEWGPSVGNIRNHMYHTKTSMCVLHHCMSVW